MQVFSDRVEAAGLVISRARTPHALLGEAHAIEQGGRTVTFVSVIDWERPTQIPTIAEPGRLPPGAGGVVLDGIARRARAAGVAALRYAGPYPTPALYRTLRRSFRASAPESEFTADLLARAARIARDEVPVDFAPAPHDRVEHARGHAEVRDGVERAVIDGIPYERDGSPARLVPGGEGWAAEVWFGDAPWARVAELAPDGQLARGPFAIPQAPATVLGKAFPPPLCAALAELIADLVPAPLARAATDRMRDREIAWADLGARAARRSGQRFEVHAALWERVAPLGMARLALALAEALAPVVTVALVAEVTGVA